MDAMKSPKPPAALLAKFRRKANRAIKQGEKSLGGSGRKLCERNTARNELIQGLNRVQDTGTAAEKAGARKAKKRLSVDWRDRTDTADLTGYWNPNESRPARA